MQNTEGAAVVVTEKRVVLVRTGPAGLVRGGAVGLVWSDLCGGAHWSAWICHSESGGPHSLSDWVGLPANGSSLK